MLPTAYRDDLTADFTVERLPSRTPRLNPDFLRVRGEADGLEAVKQAVYLILNTQRYAWLIHSWNYGVELHDLVGRELLYCKAEIQLRISEALLQDDRITAVERFTFETGKKKLRAAFAVVSIYGTIQTETEVDI